VLSPGESYSLALGIFPQLLGFVYLLACVSLLAQVKGLYGSQGILPINEVATALKRRLGVWGFLRFPSIFWFNSSDQFITTSAWLGCFLSLYLLVGFPPLPALVLLWLIYLSFVSMGREFLSFQWDALLLETGFMTMFLPLAPHSSALVIMAYQFFIFRFMLSAGTVKLTSQDPNWRNLSAMSFHYETQPIPNRLAWYAHQLPEGLQKFSTVGTFLFELLIPLLILGPAPFKLACFCLLTFFQGLILITGNYGFFNILTIVLAAPLVDDRYLGRLMKSQSEISSVPYLDVMLSVIFAIFFILNLLQLIRLFMRPHWLTRILSQCGRWHISNPYGLFAVMTTKRYEFVIEGSNDLKSWLPYEFYWKPGDPATPPRQVAPHQPRLDWQMWFAALNPTYVEPWLSRLIERLLEGSTAVQGLFRTIPFKASPPRYIRLRVYRYHFTDLAAKKATGEWWQRREISRSEAMTLGQ